MTARTHPGGRHTLIVLCLASGVLGFAAAPVGAATFQWLGSLLPPEGASEVNDVNADGSVVVGRSNSPDGSQAFRWTPGGGMVGLGDLPGGGFGSSASGVSGDGRTVVGNGTTVTGDYETGARAFRWVAGMGGGMQDISGTLGDYVWAWARAASGDGAIVVGGTNWVGLKAFRWTEATGLQPLIPAAPPGLTYCDAYDMSADGQTVVGVADFGNEDDEPFRWTAGGGIEGLGSLPGGYYSGIAHAVSADGDVVVGYSFSESGREAFRWTAGEGMVPLGDLPEGDFRSEALGVSGDGSTIVGYGTTDAGRGAFVWTADAGMRSIEEMLEADYGIDMSGCALDEATGVSANGLAIVGNVQGPFHNEGWLIWLDPPERHWTCAAGGNWETADNWDLPMPAGATTEVYIEQPGVTVLGFDAPLTIKSLTVDSGAGGELTSLQLQNAGHLTVTRQITVGSSGRIAGAGRLVAGDGIANQGEIDLGADALQLGGGMLTNEGLLCGSGRVENRLTNGPDGEVRVMTGQRLMFTGPETVGPGPGPGNINRGQIHVLGGTIEFAHDLWNEAGGTIYGRGLFTTTEGLTNEGQVTFSGGDSDVFGDVENAPGGSVLILGGNTTAFFGNVAHNGTEFRVREESFAVFFGDVTGGGDFTGDGTVQFEGGMYPGNSAALVSFAGDVVFTPSATLEIEIGGPLRGDDYDALLVGDELTLAGTLRVVLSGGFAPDEPMRFDILDWTSQLGQFDVLDLPILPAGWSWDTADLYTTGEIGVVPEPAALSLLALSGLALIGQRRRK